MKLREQILNIDDIQEEVVDIPSWGVKVLVRGLSGKERAKLMQEATDARGVVNFAKLYPNMIIACTYDPETKERLFEDTDRDALMSKSAAALDILFNVANKLSGIGAEVQEQIEKN